MIKLMLHIQIINLSPWLPAFSPCYPFPVSNPLQQVSSPSETETKSLTPLCTCEDYMKGLVSALILKWKACAWRYEDVVFRGTSNPWFSGNFKTLEDLIERFLVDFSLVMWCCSMWLVLLLRSRQILLFPAKMRIQMGTGCKLCRSNIMTMKKQLFPYECVR